MPLILNKPANYNSPILKGYYGNEHKPYIQGLGQVSVCDPGFVGPLSPEQQTECNLQAGIDYRDILLQQQQQQQGSIGFNINSISTWLQQNAPLVIFSFLGLIIFNDIVAGSGSSKGRR